MISAKVAIIIYTTRKTRIEMTNIHNILTLYRKRIHHPANGGFEKRKKAQKGNPRNRRYAAEPPIYKRCGSPHAARTLPPHFLASGSGG